MEKLEYCILKNKRGAEKILSIWWFFVLAIVGLGIVAGVFIFYSADVDVREIESTSLYDNIVDCIAEQGFLSDGLLKEDFDIFKECRLNKNILNNGYFYIKIKFLDNAKSSIREDIVIGNNAFKKDCEISLSKDVKAEKFPKCVNGSEDFLYYKDNQIKTATLNILTVSNQKGIEVSI